MRFYPHGFRRHLRDNAVRRDADVWREYARALQRQYHLARQNIAGLHSIPQLLIPAAETNAGIPAITNSLAVRRPIKWSLLADQPTAQSLADAVQRVADGRLNDLSLLCVLESE